MRWSLWLGESLEKAHHFPLSFLKLVNLAGMALIHLFHPCVNSLLYLLIKVVSTSASTHIPSFLHDFSPLQDLVLALQLLLDSQEARVDLFLQVFDRLVRINGKQALRFLLLRLDDKQVLVAEGALTKLELEDGL